MILGLSYMYHDSAACLVSGGRVVAAAAEERFNRVKHTIEFPHHAVEFCLKQAGLRINDVEAVVFYEKPFQKFERILRTYISSYPRSYRSFRQFLPLWLKYKLFIPQKIRQELGYRGRICFADHHLAHAASAYFTSPFEEAAVITTDGTGEWTTLSCGTGIGPKLSLKKELRFPHSLGLLYSAVTAHLGFEVNNGEGKVMALAAYGEPAYEEEFRKIITRKSDGSFRLNMDYFSYHSDLVMTSPLFSGMFGPAREPGAPLTARDKNLAATLQKTVEEVLIDIARQWQKETGMRSLCLAGGVALNCVANHRILTNTDFQNIFIQPASGDDGGALGGALWTERVLRPEGPRVAMTDAFWGPAYSDAEVEGFLRERRIPYRRYDDRKKLYHDVARKIHENKIVGYFHGRMEFGPRSLGARSILANPANPETRDILNRKVKHREPFRPFAPAVLSERASDYFETSAPSPYMLLAAPVRPEMRDRIPAACHVDGLARLQTVSRSESPDFHALIQAFHEASGIPLLINTSFNDKGEPIVCSPLDAFLCFMNTEMDYLAMENCLLSRAPGGPE